MKLTYSAQGTRAFLLRQTLGTVRRSFCFLLIISLVSCGRSDNASTSNSSTTSNITPTVNATDVVQGSATLSPVAQSGTPTSSVTNEVMDGGTGYPVPNSNVPVQSEVEGLYTSPSLGVVIDKEMKVLVVEPNSAAEKGGIQVDDVIDSIDDTKIVSNVDNVKKLISSAKKDQKIKLKLKRKGKDVQIDVVPVSSLPSELPTRAPGQVLPTSTPVAPPDDYL